MVAWSVGRAKEQRIWSWIWRKFQRSFFLLARTKIRSTFSSKFNRRKVDRVSSLSEPIRLLWMQGLSSKTFQIQYHRSKINWMKNFLRIHVVWYSVIWASNASIFFCRVAWILEGTQRLANEEPRFVACSSFEGSVDSFRFELVDDVSTSSMNKWKKCDNNALEKHYSY